MGLHDTSECAEQKGDTIHLLKLQLRVTPDQMSRVHDLIPQMDLAAARSGHGYYDGTGCGQFYDIWFHASDPEQLLEVVRPIAMLIPPHPGSMASITRRDRCIYCHTGDDASWSAIPETYNEVLLC